MPKLPQRRRGSIINSLINKRFRGVFGWQPMQVAVELFGIARARAGVARTTAEGRCLGDVLAELATRFPALADSCIEGRQLRPHCTANLGGERFVSAPETPLCEGDTVLLLSADGGG